LWVHGYFRRTQFLTKNAAVIVRSGKAALVALTLTIVAWTMGESVIFSVRGIHTRSHAFPAPIGGGLPSTGDVGRCWGVPRWGGSFRVVVSRPGEHGVAVRVVSKVQDPRGPKTLLVLHLQGWTMPWLCCCWHYQCHSPKTLSDTLTDCH
jgi:hypothetical protein